MMRRAPKCTICQLDESSSIRFIRFHCQCKSSLCEDCARISITNKVNEYPETFNNGVQCPSCKVTSDNIRNGEECQSAESNIIEAAFTFYQPVSQNRRSVLDINRILLRMLHQENFVGNVTTTEIDNATDARIRLEVALLFSDKVNMLEEYVISFSCRYDDCDVSVTERLNAALEIMHKKGGSHNRNPLLLLNFTRCLNAEEENALLREEIADLKAQLHVNDRRDDVYVFEILFDLGLN